jgi:hypothetical protein
VCGRSLRFIYALCHRYEITHLPLFTQHTPSRSFFLHHPRSAGVAGLCPHVHVAALVNQRLQDLQLAEPRGQVNRPGPAAPGRLHGSFWVRTARQQGPDGASAAAEDGVVEERPAELRGARRVPVLEEQAQDGARGLVVLHSTQDGVVGLGEAGAHAQLLAGGRVPGPRAQPNLRVPLDAGLDMSREMVC